MDPWLLDAGKGGVFAIATGLVSHGYAVAGVSVFSQGIGGKSFGCLEALGRSGADP